MAGPPDGGRGEGAVFTHEPYDGSRVHSRAKGHEVGPSPLPATRSMVLCMDMARGVDSLGMIRMDDDECWNFVSRHWLGRIGLVQLGNPLIFPVNYACNEETVVFRTAPGTKLTTANRELADGRQRVVFEVDEATELFETGTSVMVHGTMREVTDPDERAELSRLNLRTWAPGDRDHIVVIEPDRVSGRRIPMHQDDDGLGADGG